MTSRGQTEITFVDASETGTKFVLGLLVFDIRPHLMMMIFSGVTLSFDLKDNRQYQTDIGLNPIPRGFGTFVPRGL